MLNKTVLFILFTFFYGGTLSQDLNCLKFDPPDLSFDTIYLDPQKKEAKFEWQVSVINPTDHTIKIERILPSSSNMVAQSKKKLLRPGEISEIRIWYNAITKYQTRFNKKFVVETDHCISILPLNGYFKHLPSN